MPDHRAFGFFSLAKRDLKNRPWRTLAAAASFAVISATIFSAQYLVGGAQQSLDNGLNRRGADIMVVPAEYSAAGENSLLTGRPTTFFFRDTGFEAIAKVPGVARASPEIFIGTLYGQSCCAGPVQLIAIDPSSDFTISSWLKENPSVAMGRDDIIVGSAILGDVGSDLKFYGHTFHIVGRLDQTGLPGVDMAVFTRFEDAYTMADESASKAARTLSLQKGVVSAVLVRVAPGADHAAVAGEIQKQVPGTKTIMPDGLHSIVSARLGSLSTLLYASGLVVTIVTIPLLASLAAMVAHERRRDIAILRALGASRAFARNLLLAESCLLSLAGALAGIGTAAICLVAFHDFVAISLKIPFTIPGATTILSCAGIALLLPVASGILATLIPALRTGMVDPYLTIREAGP